MNLLFWNLKGNSIEEYILECLQENNIDIAIFSEYTGIDFKSIESITSYKHYNGFGGCEKITVLAREDIKVSIVQEQNRYTIYSIFFHNIEYHIVGIHLQDRRSCPGPAKRLNTIRRIIKDVEDIEKRTKNQNTIVIGDFNANPYDPELLQMDAFNAVLFKELINQSATNKVDGITYKRFYNPILDFISEDSQNYGSFRYTSGDANPIWNCLDQVIVRKLLVDNIKNVKYLRYIENKKLIKNRVPNVSISDHLPLFVEIV